MSEPPKAHCFLVMRRDREIVARFLKRNDAWQAATTRLAPTLPDGFIIEACNREQILAWLKENPL